MSSSGVTPRPDMIGVKMISSGIGPNPADGCLAILDCGRKGRLSGEPIVYADNDVTLRHEV